MPIHTNSIGLHTFIDLQGTIDPRGEQLELFARPGFDGVVARRTGQRGEPFVLRSISYHTDFSASKTALLAFKANQGVDPQDVIQYSVNYGVFLVLRVRQVECHVMQNCTAGAFTVRMICDWELLG